MPVHDWNRVEAGIFHGFHTLWIGTLNNALNGELLPDEYYALPEQHTEARHRSPAIRHISGHRLVALVEILSPGNKERAAQVEAFADKIVSALHAQVHGLLVDPFPPGPHDPNSIHGVIPPSLMVKVNSSTPLKPVAGVYVTVPSWFTAMTTISPVAADDCPKASVLM